MYSRNFQKLLNQAVEKLRDLHEAKDAPRMTSNSIKRRLKSGRNKLKNEGKLNISCKIILINISDEGRR
jgi:hypothetical protein